MIELDFQPAGQVKRSVLLTEEEWDFIQQLLQRGENRKLKQALPCLTEGPNSTICYLPFKHQSDHIFETEKAIKGDPNEHSHSSHSDNTTATSDNR